MKNLLIVGLIGLASCQSSGLTYRAAEIGGGLGTYDEDSDDTFGNAVDTRVSVLLQQEDMPIGGVSEQNHAKGFVTEVGLNSSNATGEVVVPGAGLFAGPQTFTTNLDYLEGDAGLRYYLDTGTKFFQPYLGVGAGVHYSQISVGSASTDAMSVGHALHDYDALVRMAEALAPVFMRT